MKINRQLAWAQLAISILLAILSIAMYVGYRGSLANMSKAIADNMLAASDAVEQVAVFVSAREDLLAEGTRTIASTKRLLEGIQHSAESQEALLPRYATDLKSSSLILADLSMTFREIGEGLDFRVPAGIKWEGRKVPMVDWARPFVQQSINMKSHANRIRALGETIGQISERVGADGVKMNGQLIEQARQSVTFLEALEGTTASLHSTELPAAIRTLKATAGRLQESAGQAGSLEWFIEGFLLMWTLAAGLMAVNSVGTLVVTHAKSQDSLT